MCGGRGTRLGGDTEKPLVRVADRPMVDRVIAALAASRIDRVRAVVSPHATATREHLAERAVGTDSRLPLRVVDAPGDGYVADLRYALGDAESAADPDVDPTISPPVLTVAADLPLLDGEVVDRVIDAAAAVESASLTVCVPAARKRELGVSADGAFEADGRSVVPAGINAVGGVDADENDDGRGDSEHDTGRDDTDADPDESDDALRVTTDRRIAVNVNYPSDVRIAEALLRSDHSQTPPP
ncbi:NTP transferase domain-containing protein [Halorubrum laminariae]|nr:NTP transferase domain-containing protein [Halorubrum laminariae]